MRELEDTGIGSGMERRKHGLSDLGRCAERAAFWHKLCAVHSGFHLHTGIRDRVEGKMLTDLIRPQGTEALWHQEGGRRAELRSSSCIAVGSCVSKVLPQKHLNHPHPHSHEKKPQTEPLHCPIFSPLSDFKATP